MKYFILLALVALASAGPRPRWPRLPVGWKPPSDDSRIVGGYDVSIYQHPYQVALLRRGFWGTYSFFCGGSIISDKVILTAAHCLYGSESSPSDFRIRYGSTYHASGGYEVNVQSIIVHESYDPSTTNNDVALMHLETAVNTANFPPISLATSESVSGDTVTVTGWGATSEGGSISSSLQAVKVTVLSNSECRQYGYGIADIRAGMLCATISGGGYDSCQGDSGGPMQASDGTQAGVVSWGIGCARPDYPGVYARVSYYRDWINTNGGL